MKPGDQVRQFDKICEVQSDKASVEITSPYDGLVKVLHFNVDDVAMVGAALLDIEIEDDSKNPQKIKEDIEDQVIDDSNKKKEKNEETDGTKSQDNFTEKVLATPAVRKIATENNVKLKDVAATGKDGRVLKEDVLAHLQKISATVEVRAEVSPNVTGRTVGLKGYSRHMWKTMTRSLVSHLEMLKTKFSADKLFELC